MNCHEDATFKPLLVLLVDKRFQKCEKSILTLREREREIASEKERVKETEGEKKKKTVLR